MWRDAKFAEMISTQNKEKEISAEFKKKLAELETKKNEKGELVLDMDDLTDE